MGTRLCNDSSLGHVFAWWHNLEIFAFAASRSPELYPSVLYNLREYEASALLFVETPPVYSYHSYADGDAAQGMVQSIEISEVFVPILLYFVHSDARGTIFRECSDPRLPNNTGIILTLGQKVRELVDAVRFCVIIEGCDLDKSPAYFAYKRSADVYWTDLRMEALFLTFPLVACIS